MSVQILPQMNKCVYALDLQIGIQCPYEKNFLGLVKLDKVALSISEAILGFLKKMILI